MDYAFPKDTDVKPFSSIIITSRKIVYTSVTSKIGKRKRKARNVTNDRLESVWWFTLKPFVKEPSVKSEKSSLRLCTKVRLQLLKITGRLSRVFRYIGD